MAGPNKKVHTWQNSGKTTKNERENPRAGRGEREKYERGFLCLIVEEVRGVRSWRIREKVLREKIGSETRTAGLGVLTGGLRV